MKKIIALLLSLTLTLLSMVALAGCGECETHVDADRDNLCDECGEEYIAPADGVADTIAYYANSQPQKVESKSTQDYYEFDEEGNEFVAYTLNLDSILKTGTVNGLVATVEIQHRDILASVGAEGQKKPVIETVTTTDEFLQGYGRRRNVAEGNDWVAGGLNFAPAKGSIAINLDKANLENVTYVEAPYNNVLTFTVSVDKIEAVFGTAITSDTAITVSITNDGAVVTGIKISYGIKATGNFPKCLVVEEVKYDYSVQRVDLVS